MSTFKVLGACATTAKNVFKVKFSYPLSSKPNLRAYDNNQTFPNTGALTTNTYTIFTGVAANNNKPMLRFIDTTRAGAGASNWYTNSTILTTATNCMMRGDTSYLNFAVTIASMIIANASVQWNACVIVPSTVNPTMTRLHDIAVRYTFTSTIPVVSFYANNSTDGGTDAIPVWGTIVENSRGVRFGSATATNTSILANIPISGEEVSQTAWVSST